MQGSSGSKASPSLWWTPPRSRLAGMAGIAGGVIWITMMATIVTTMGFDALNFEPGTAGPVADATITISHSVMYALMLVAVLAANARYGAYYGWLSTLRFWFPPFLSSYLCSVRIGCPVGSLPVSRS